METKEQKLQKAIMEGKIKGKNYNSRELVNILWTKVEKIKKLPEFLPSHKFSKDFAVSTIVMNIITKFEGDLINEFEEKESQKEDKCLEPKNPNCNCEVCKTALEREKREQEGSNSSQP